MALVDQEKLWAKTQLAYEAYRAWKAVATENMLPAWHEIPDSTKITWLAAVRASERMVQ